MSTLSDPVGGREVSGRVWENEDEAPIVEGSGFEEAGVMVGEASSWLFWER